MAAGRNKMARAEHSLLLLGGAQSILVYRVITAFLSRKNFATRMDARPDCMAALAKVLTAHDLVVTEEGHVVTRANHFGTGATGRGLLVSVSCGTFKRTSGDTSNARCPGDHSNQRPSPGRG